MLEQKEIEILKENYIEIISNTIANTIIKAVIIGIKESLKDEVITNMIKKYIDLDISDKELERWNKDPRIIKKVESKIDSLLIELNIKK